MVWHRARLLIRRTAVKGRPVLAQFRVAAERIVLIGETSAEEFSSIDGSLATLLHSQGTIAVEVTQTDSQVLEFRP